MGFVTPSAMTPARAKSKTVRTAPPAARRSKSATAHATPTATTQRALSILGTAITAVRTEPALRLD